jgi:hypothetical protein
VFDISIQCKVLVSGMAPMQNYQGERVALSVRSDRRDGLRLNGRYLSVLVGLDQPASPRFRPGRIGRPGLKTQHAQAQLGVLEVNPR